MENSAEGMNEKGKNATLELIALESRNNDIYYDFMIYLAFHNPEFNKNHLSVDDGVYAVADNSDLRFIFDKSKTLVFDYITGKERAIEDIFTDYPLGFSGTNADKAINDRLGRTLEQYGYDFIAKLSDNYSKENYARELLNLGAIKAVLVFDKSFFELEDNKAYLSGIYEAINSGEYLLPEKMIFVAEHKVYEKKPEICNENVIIVSD